MRFLFCSLMIISFPFMALSQTKVKLSDLNHHIGDSITVEGQVKTIAHRDSTSSSPTLITIGNLAGTLTVVIESSVRDKFSVKPEESYRNKTIQVSGKLLNNNDKMQIVILDPSQIVLIDHK
jgi:hypothetical protein